MFRQRTLLILLVMLFVMTSIANAAAYVKYIGGIGYYKGDLNLPVWSAGSAMVSVAERSSAVLASEDKQQVTVDFYGFDVVGRGSDGEYDPPHESDFRTERFTYYKSSGTYVIWGETSLRKVWWTAGLNVFPLLIDSARANKEE